MNVRPSRTPRKLDADTPEAMRERLALLEAEMHRLVELKRVSERDRNNAAKMIVLIVFAVPAGYFWNVWIGLAVAVQVLLIIVGTWYITGVHILEYRGNIEDCEMDLRVVRGALAGLPAGETLPEGESTDEDASDEAEAAGA